MSRGLSNAEVAELYERLGHLVLRRCRAITRSDALADDALQKVFVKVMRYGASLREADSQLRWLYRAADRCCFDLLGKQKRRAEVAEVDERAGPDPTDQLAARDAVLSLLGRLGEKERRIAVLAWVDGMSQGQIAEETGTSRQTINKKLQRIQRRAEAVLRSAR